MEGKNHMLKIGELAGRLGLNVRTLRYYEGRGLLKPSGRSVSGYRLYSESDEQLLRFPPRAFGPDQVSCRQRLGVAGFECVERTQDDGGGKVEVRRVQGDLRIE